MRNFRKHARLYPAMVFVLGLCFIAAGAEDSFITLDNAGAAVAGADYDATAGYILNPGTGSKVTSTVGDNASGNFSVYLEVSRAAMGFGTTPFSISVNNGQETVPIIEYGFCKADKSDIYDDTSMSAIYNTDQYREYMSDGVHPTADGYKAWWGPKFEQALTFFSSTDGTAVPNVFTR